MKDFDWTQVEVVEKAGRLIQNLADQAAIEADRSGKPAVFDLALSVMADTLAKVAETMGMLMSEPAQEPIPAIAGYLKPISLDNECYTVHDAEGLDALPKGTIVAQHGTPSVRYARRLEGDFVGLNADGTPREMGYPVGVFAQCYPLIVLNPREVGLTALALTSV